MSILDWQIARYCPPVLDLLYNVFSSTDKPFRDQYYETLLKTYHASLSDTIRKLGSDPTKLYSYEHFLGQLRKYGDFTLLCAPLLISIRVAQAKNATENDDSIGKREKVLSNIHNHEQTQTEYSRLINDLVTDLVNYGYVTIE